MIFIELTDVQTNKPVTINVTQISHYAPSGIGTGTTIVFDANHKVHVKEMPDRVKNDILSALRSGG